MWKSLLLSLAERCPKKLGDAAASAILVEDSVNHKSYKRWDLKRSNVIIFRDVKFIKIRMIR